MVPAAFDLDLFDDGAWLGVVPFHMSNVGLRATPAVPWISAFPELNVRTYIRVADRPGVYFFSLDAARWLAVAAARTLLNLPYYTANMTLDWRDDGLHYESARRTRHDAQFKATYEPLGLALRGARRFNRTLPHGAILSVPSQPPGPSLPPRHSPPAVVAPDGTRDDHDEYDGRRQSGDTQRRASAIALRSAARRGRLGTDVSARACPADAMTIAPSRYLPRPSAGFAQPRRSAVSVLHLRRRETGAPPTAGGFRQIDERTLLDRQSSDSQIWRKAAAYRSARCGRR